MQQVIRTPLCELFGIKHPIIQAGMNVAAGPELAAAVTNAGGLGVIGGLGYTPKFLRQQIATLKSHLVDKNAPFGVDLLLPKVGEGARKTNYDYTKGELPELIEAIIEGGAHLFVCAVGVPPRWVVDKLHAANILVMNMTGLPKHALSALDAGCDIICAQGTEAGGHTGDLATSVLIPATVDVCAGKESPLTGKPVLVVAAGGIYDGRGLAMSLALGASGVWVGTRFVCATEAGAAPQHQQEILSADFDSTFRTLFYTGRPLRVKKKKLVVTWETERRGDMQKLLNSGTIPYQAYEDELRAAGKEEEERELMGDRRLLMGQCAGAIRSIVSARQIVESMVAEAAAYIRHMDSMLVAKPKL